MGGSGDNDGGESKKLVLGTWHIQNADSIEAWEDREEDKEIQVWLFARACPIRIDYRSPEERAHLYTQLGGTLPSKPEKPEILKKDQKEAKELPLWAPRYFLKRPDRDELIESATPWIIKDKGYLTYRVLTQASFPLAAGTFMAAKDKWGKWYLAYAVAFPSYTCATIKFQDYGDRYNETIEFNANRLWHVRAEEPKEDDEESDDNKPSAPDMQQE